MSGKLTKTETGVETAEEFAEAIGKAIENNDVNCTQELSHTLREKLEEEVCVCGHPRRLHAAARLVNVGACLFGTAMAPCNCRAFVSVNEQMLPLCAAPAPASMGVAICQRSAGHDGAHAGPSFDRMSVDIVWPR